MPPRYVKPYVKRNKNDAADAEAICEAVRRPNMRFVPIKTLEQQSVLMLHRTRQLFVRQRTSLINAIRAHMAEFGIVAGVGRNGVEVLLKLITEGKDDQMPAAACECLMALAAQLELVKRLTGPFVLQPLPPLCAFEPPLASRNIRAGALPTAHLLSHRSA